MKRSTSKGLKYLKHLNLDPGCPITVQAEKGKNRFECRLLTIVQDSYLVVATDKLNELFAELSPTKPVLKCYCMCTGMLCGFKAALVNHVTDPAQIMFLSYPNLFIANEIRRHRRVFCFFPAYASIGDREHHVAILDISLSGCKFAAELTEDEHSQIEQEESVTLFFLLGAMGALTISGRIRNRTREGNKTLIGLEFEALDEGLIKELADFLSIVEQYDRGRGVT